MPFQNLTEPNPNTLTTDEYLLRPITADDAALDYEAVMDSRSYLRDWEQTGWPDDGFTVAENRKDLEDLQERHAAGRALTFTVLAPLEKECLGCVYVFPPEATFLSKSTVTPLDGDIWEEQDAVVYFWVRPTPMASGMDQRLLQTLRKWLRDEWHFRDTVYVTSELFRGQVTLLGGTDMVIKFDIREPGKPGKYLAFG